NFTRIEDNLRLYSSCSGLATHSLHCYSSLRAKGPSDWNLAHRVNGLRSWNWSSGGRPWGGKCCES
ncbi:hypothetical protein PENTCL1PPCAC_7647, partial [Pristionchus entomophagus]